MKNVLMLSIDDMLNVVKYRDTFGVEIQTPNIDRLIEMGVNFENAFATTPLCNPSRTAVLSGKSAFTTGVHHNNGRKMFTAVDPDDTIPAFFQDAGYFTASKGKVFHDSDAEPTAEALARIFDLFEPATGFEKNGEAFEVAGVTWKDEDQLVDAQTAAWAADFLTNYDSEDPFFAAVGIYKPHLNWSVPKEYFDLYDSDLIDAPDFGGTPEDLPEFFQQFIWDENAHDKAMDAAEWTHLIHSYLAAVSFADKQIGEVMNAMDDAELWEETTLILWSDHGYHLGDKDTWRKFTLWENSASAPLIIVDPDVGEPGTTVTQPVSMLDIWPTIASLTGHAAPADLEGVDLTKLMVTPDLDLGRSGVITSLYGSLSVRTEDYRYNLYNDGEVELFDAIADPMNETDLSDNPAYAGILQEMRAELAEEALKFGVHISSIGNTAGQNATPGGEVEHILGADENDIFILGDNSMGQGGDGDDVYYIVDGASVQEDRDGGMDTVVVATTRAYTAPSNIENIELVKGTQSQVTGNGKDNVIFGSNYGNRIGGGNGDDLIDGDGGADRLKGGKGDDFVAGGLGRDIVEGGEGDDIIFGDKILLTDQSDLYSRNGVGVGFIKVKSGGERDELYGDEGEDIIRGGGGNDDLYGGDGRDWLEGGRGHDVLRGGRALDVADYAESEDAVQIDLRTGSAVGGDADGDEFYSIEGVAGSANDDILIGDADDNLIYGRAGDDKMQGLGGGDLLDGGEGVDQVDYRAVGGQISADLRDGVAETGNGRNDTLVNVENLISGDGADLLAGNETANSLYGGAGSDLLRGREGSDLLDGGAGGDRLMGGLGFDTARYSESPRAVKVYLADGRGYGGQATGDVLDGIEALIGSKRDDGLYGDDEANVLEGRGGNDILRGQKRSDQLIGGGGDDVLHGGRGNDILGGGDGSDKLFGGDGADTITGGAGADILSGGGGVDTFVFGGGSGDDVITDWQSGLDRLHMIGSYADLTFAQSGEDTVIQMSNGSTITLNGVLIADLSVTDMVFI